jgi:hypothetical protein
MIYYFRKYLSKDIYEILSWPFVGLICLILLAEFLIIIRENIRLTKQIWQVITGKKEFVPA